MKKIEAAVWHLSGVAWLIVQILVRGDLIMQTLSAVLGISCFVGAIFLNKMAKPEKDKEFRAWE